jgi:hypothetical protein
MNMKASIKNPAVPVTDGLTQRTLEVQGLGFELFDAYEGVEDYRRMVPGFGNGPAKDDRREWLRFEGGKWCGFAHHNNAHGEIWYETSQDMAGTPAEIGSLLEKERETAPRREQDAR